MISNRYKFFRVVHKIRHFLETTNLQNCFSKNDSVGNVFGVLPDTSFCSVVKRCKTSRYLIATGFLTEEYLNCKHFKWYVRHNNFQPLLKKLMNLEMLRKIFRSELLSLEAPSQKNFLKVHCHSIFHHWKYSLKIFFLICLPFCCLKFNVNRKKLWQVLLKHFALPKGEFDCVCPKHFFFLF